MRDELLNGEIFFSLREAEVIIEGWRKHYNNKRPHSCSELPPTCARGHGPDEPNAKHAHAFKQDHSSGAAQLRTSERDILPRLRTHCTKPIGRSKPMPKMIFSASKSSWPTFRLTSQKRQPSTWNTRHCEKISGIVGVTILWPELSFYCANFPYEPRTCIKGGLAESSVATAKQGRLIWKPPRPAPG